MKRKYLFGIMALLLMFSVAGLVYAHSGSFASNDFQAMPCGNIDADSMNQIHEEMMQYYSDDSEFVSYMDEMHEAMNEYLSDPEFSEVMHNYNRGYMMNGFHMIN